MYSVPDDAWYLELDLVAYQRTLVTATDSLADVTVHVAVGGRTWKEGSRAASRTVHLPPTGIAYDAQTGEKLPSDL
ncbi:hypothetical protein M2158_004533 [Streptomyces sp. SAI-144]|jgi:hypothetical protein|uniref:hypothetical protein n=1 Tax=Streptomyces sp. SAI-144 TaxID=2940544 RepID=UPI0024768FC0|nr:hypothetical protein [Streptomyces sp. SAI-144]MDH6435993.1 hypothetical protein [Streptomyces sp. SAI-144]